MKGDQDDLLQFFAYSHLPPDLQTFSKPFSNVASWLVETLPRNPERTVALRKLLEAKDCAVRARLFKSTQAPQTAPVPVDPPSTPAPAGKPAKGQDKRRASSS